MRQSTVTLGLNGREAPLSATSLDADPPRPLQPQTPQWVTDAMPDARVFDACPSVQATRSDALVLLSTTVANAGRMDADMLRAEVTHAYVTLGRALDATRSKAIRLWNYLPDPGCGMGPGLDRYMVFNAGRHNGYRRWFPEAHRFETSLATASAVGIGGDDLVVHCLASHTEGRAVENPRQKPAWRYSSRYGPMPPSFSRATITTIGEHHCLLIGGTASIVGEDSVHAGDVSAQLEETLRNIATLVAAAREQPEPPTLSLSGITDVRVYLTRREDSQAIYSALRARCPDVTRIEMAIASLCRPELLVEIEGVAAL